MMGSAHGATSRSQVLLDHAEWMLLPALRLHRHLMALADACARDAALEQLRPVLALSPLERAVCIGQRAFLDAKARVDELDPGRQDHNTISGARGWLRQCKELVRAEMGDAVLNRVTL
jgi:hypothetical protein